MNRREIIKNFATLGAGAFVLSREPVANSLAKVWNYTNGNEKINGQRIYIGDQCIKLVPFTDYNPPKKGAIVEDLILEIEEEIGELTGRGYGIYNLFFEADNHIKDKKEKDISKKIADDFLEKYGENIFNQDSKEIIEQIARFIVDKVTYFKPGEDNLKNYEDGIGICKNYADYMKFAYMGLQEKNPELKNSGSVSIVGDVKSSLEQKINSFLLRLMGLNGNVHVYNLFYSKIPDKDGNLQGTMVDATWADEYSIIPSGVFSKELFEVDRIRFPPKTHVAIQETMMNTEATLSIGDEYLKSDDVSRKEKSEIAGVMAISIDNASTLLEYGSEYLNGLYNTAIYSFVKKHYPFSSMNEAKKEMIMLKNL